jgi:hypothetical protein
MFSEVGQIFYRYNMPVLSFNSPASKMVEYEFGEFFSVYFIG